MGTPEQTLRALQDAFVTHHQHLKRLACRIVGNPEIAEDIVHDAYLKAMDHPPPGAVAQALPYVQTMVRNLAIDRYHRHALESRLFCSGLDTDSCDCAAAVRADSAESHAADRQVLHLVIAALADLPERCRQVFELHRLQGLTQREIATRLCISPAMVHLLVHQAAAHCRAAVPGRG